MQQHKNIEIEMLIDLNKKINLMNYDAIYIGGGNTFKLLKKIKDSGFDKKLLDFYKNGKIIYGGSAGAIIFGKDIRIAGICKDADKNQVKLKDTTGISLINFEIQCHFEDNQLTEHKEFIKKTRRTILAIPEESGIILENNQLVAIGAKPVTLIKKDIIKRYKNGEIIK